MAFTPYKAIWCASTHRRPYPLAETDGGIAMQLLIDIIMKYGLWSLPLLLPIHEGGHYIACLVLTGKRIKFNWGLGKYYLPYGTWYMPDGISLWKRRVIAFAGFGTQFFCALFLPRVYLIYAVFNFMKYPFRFPKGGDFQPYNIVGGE